MFAARTIPYARSEGDQIPNGLSRDPFTARLHPTDKHLGLMRVTGRGGDTTTQVGFRSGFSLSFSFDSIKQLVDEACQPHRTSTTLSEVKTEHVHDSSPSRATNLHGRSLTCRFALKPEIFTPERSELFA